MNRRSTYERPKVQWLPIITLVCLILSAGIIAALLMFGLRV